jgi:acyl-coenzyme A synthetase/AMP-(fatty) acid ligase
MNLVDALRHHARMRPHDLAVVHPTGALDYLQLARTVAALAQHLRGNGIARGMKVAIYVSDPFMHLALILAAMLNGTVTISAHPNYDPIPPGADIDVYLTDKTLPFPTSARVVPVASSWLQAETEAGAGRPILEGEGFSGPGSLARMYTSSGTTGEPKVVGHTEESLHQAVLASVMTQPLIHGPNLSMMWLSTIGGFGTAQATLWHGCTLVMATTPAVVLRAMTVYRVVFLRASPQQLQGLLQAFKGRDLRFPFLQRIEVGGAHTASNVVVAARATLCPNVMGVYGATEVGLVAQSPAGLMHAQPDAAGYVVPGASVRIVDEMGSPVAPGVEGIVQVRTPSMADGYMGDPQTSALAFRDGWFVPGDLGVLGADGLLRLRGRADELINAGGVKLNPAMVDEFLLAQPDVRDAAAFAFRQTGRSDEVWAAVVAGEGLNEQALLAACRAKLNSRAPVRVVRMSEIPRNAMGKPMRQKLSQDAKLN